MNSLFIYNAAITIQGTIDYENVIFFLKNNAKYLFVKKYSYICGVLSR